MALSLAPLRAILRAKQLPNRPKDRAYLEANREAIEEMLRRERRRPRRGR